MFSLFQHHGGARRAHRRLITSFLLLMLPSHPFPTRAFLLAYAHRRPWVSVGCVCRYCRYSERASCFISSTSSSKGTVLLESPLIGTDLTRKPACQMSNCFSGALIKHASSFPASSRGTSYRSWLIVRLASDCTGAARRPAH